MSTSTKTPASIRQAGLGASHENAKKPLEIKKPPADSDRRDRSKVPAEAARRTSGTAETRSGRAEVRR